MASSDFRRVEALFEEAAELPAAERADFLARACGDDAALRGDVESLLEADTAAGDFLVRPALRRPTRGGPLASGSVLGGRYRIERLLGRGAMGDVYRADDLTLGEPVALKLLPEGARDAARLHLFASEARVARRITHPNVCRVHDLGDADGVPFLTMELVEGEELGAVLAREPSLPESRAADIARQTCEGLAAAHERGILHRDLKPSNLMLDRDGRVRLVDFGLAGLLGSPLRGGTPAYMAPELFGGGAASVQSDLYALGLVLYQLYTGRRAFAAAPESELARQHREVTPPRPSSARPSLAPAVERAILSCLQKDPDRRPRSARAVAAALAGADTGEGGVELSLRAWPRPDPPPHPYPLLLPYEHPDLLAGRERDVETLARLLRSPVPILGLAAPSGTGKSSLLLAGLAPRLRAEGRAVAVERHPAEPGIAGRLIGDLLDAADAFGIALGDADVDGFLRLLARCESLSGGAPVLILDQFEDVLRLDAARARAVLGVLLAATCRPRPGASGPPCRWLLAFREDALGKLLPWLSDTTADARREGFPGADRLPHDVSGAERFQCVPLSPLGTPAPALRDPLEEATAVFRAAIERPLALRAEDGRPRYALRFAGDGARRLARAFAEARLARPATPLTPELQVVLARLVADAAPRGPVLEVPRDVGALVDRALDDHLARALEAAFPARPGAAQERARALLALRELAGATGAREEGMPAATLERALGAEGREVLERLAAADTRLVLRQDGPDGPRWLFSHDRMAEAVARLVDEEGRGGGVTVDGEVLALRRLVALETALHRSGEPSATKLSARTHRQIARSKDALLWDDARRAWWDACVRRRRADRKRIGARAALVATLLAIAGVSLAMLVQRRAARAALLTQVEKGDPEAAFATLAGALDEGRIPAAELLARLRRRKSPLDVLEIGMGGVPVERRSDAVLRVGELASSLFTGRDAGLRGNVPVASLFWALDAASHRDEETERRAAALRERVLTELRERHPPPALLEGEWAALPAGTFEMGARPEDGHSGKDHESEVPLHRVAVSAFRMLDHEVTAGEYRRLVADFAGSADLPVKVSWYDAYVYAAWLGARLPTEAEWEYAARFRCAHTYCVEGGREARLDEVAWWAGNSAGPDGNPTVHPVRQKKRSAAGLFDLYGNLWEWTADWWGDYAAAAQTDPRGPTVGTEAARIVRGGSAYKPAEWAHPSSRGGFSPAHTEAIRPVIQGSGSTGRKPSSSITAAGSP